MALGTVPDVQHHAGIGVVNVALAVSLAVNVVYLAYDARWLRALGDLATTAVGLAAALAIWQVFPFAFHGSAAVWSVVLRVLVMIAIVGSCIAIVVDVVRLARAATGPGRPSRHPLTRALLRFRRSKVPNSCSVTR